MSRLLYIFVVSLLFAPCLAQAQIDQEGHGVCPSNIVKNFGNINVSCNVAVAGTPLGETEVASQKSTKASFLSSNRNGNVYVNDALGFGISWPINSTWQLKTQSSQMNTADNVVNLAYEAFFLTNSDQTNTYGAIAISVYPKTVFLIEEALSTYVVTQVNQGATIMPASMDAKNNAAILIISKNGEPALIRMLLGKDYMYLIQMLSVYPPGNEYARMRTETNMIFNSFRLIQG